MSVAVDICNSALIKLGSERINALTDNNKRAKVCQEQYSKIIEKTLRSHPWTFAIKRDILSPIVSPLEFGDENVFSLPLDCLRVVSINSRYTYKIEGRYLLTDIDSVNLSYISSTTEEALFDSNFKEAAACALAADLCYVITQSSTMRQQLLEEFNFWIAEARSYNSQEQSPDNYEFDEFTDSRRTDGINGLW